MCDSSLQALPVAKVEVTVTKTGSFTGKVTCEDAATYAIRGTFVADQNASVQFKRGLVLHTLTLAVHSDATLTASLSSPTATLGEIPSGGGVQVKTFPVGTPKADWAGPYTLALSSLTPGAGGSPGGSAYAALVVDAKGALKITGKLADGVALTGTLAPDAQRGYRWFLKPYKKLGDFLAGEIKFTARAGGKFHVVGSSGDLVLKKPAIATDKMYKTGYGPLDLLPEAEPWTAPAKSVIIGELGVTKTDRFNVNYVGAATGYSAALPTKLSLTLTNTFTVAAGNLAGWTAKVNPVNGVITGSFNVVDAGKSRKVPFEGVLLQGLATFAKGYYLLPPANTLTGTTLSGQISFAGPAELNPNLGTAGTYTTVAALSLDDAHELVGSPLPAVPSGLPKLTSVPYTGYYAGKRAVTATFVFSVAEDMQTATFNGRVLKVQTNPPLGAGVVVYTDAPTHPTNGLTIFLARNTATAQVDGVIAIYNQFKGASIVSATFGAGTTPNDSVSQPLTSVVKK